VIDIEVLLLLSFMYSSIGRCSLPVAYSYWQHTGSLGDEVASIAGYFAFAVARLKSKGRSNIRYRLSFVVYRYEYNS
jgi:hypothetical protein